jgi:hypothetical protein
MNHETPNPNPINESTLSEPPTEARCQHHTSNGRCRMPITDPSSAFCPEHARKAQKKRDQADLAAALLGDTEEFTSAVTINRSLGELYKLQARDKISPRRAAVMAYTCNLLLRTLPAIEHELNPDPDSQKIIFDLPRPKRD